MGENDYTKSPNVVVSATISVEFYNELRSLQRKGYEAARWSNVMRRGAALILDCAAGNDPYEKIELLVKRIESLSQSVQVDEVVERESESF